MSRILCVLVLLLGVAGCATQPAPPEAFVAGAETLSMPEKVSQNLRIDTQEMDVCLNQQGYFYCGESHAVVFIKDQAKTYPSNTVLVESWKVGSIFVDGEVVFVVVDDANSAVWTLPERLSRLESQFEAIQSLDQKEENAEGRAGYHCECPAFRRAFAAAAMMSTF